MDMHLTSPGAPISNVSLPQEDDDDWEIVYDTEAKAAEANAKAAEAKAAEAKAAEAKAAPATNATAAHATATHATAAHATATHANAAVRARNPNYTYFKHERDAFDDVDEEEDADKDYDKYDLERYDKKYNQHIRF
jgi:hypothetical protein